MIKSRKILTLITALLFCSGPLFAQKPAKRLTVMVTINPIGYFVKQIGQDKIELTVLVPSGADPHTYELTTGIMKQTGNADVFVKAGSGVEFEHSWFEKITSLGKNAFVIDCSTGIEIVEGDVHIWASAKNALKIAQTVYEGLSFADPLNKEYYKINLTKLINKITATDEYLSTALSGKKGKAFVVFHPEWGYFAHDYGLEQIAIEYEGKEFSAGHLKEIIEKARSAGIKNIFLSRRVNPKIAGSIAGQIGASVVYADSLSDTFIDDMKLIADTIK